MKNKSNWIKLGALGLSAVLPLSVAVKLESDRQTSVRDLHDVCRTLVPKKSYHSTGGIAELVGISKFHEIIFQNIPNADFKFRGIDIHVNSAGMRSYRDYPLEKSQGVFRIVVIGDSFTFGNGSNLEDAFPHVLEAFLNRNQWNNARYEVLNFGVSAYNSIQEAAVYENIARHYNPDLVIICAFHNDWWMPCGIRVPEGWKPGEEIDPSFLEIPAHQKQS